MQKYVFLIPAICASLMLGGCGGFTISYQPNKPNDSDRTLTDREKIMFTKLAFLSCERDSDLKEMFGDSTAELCECVSDAGIRSMEIKEDFDKVAREDERRKISEKFVQCLFRSGLGEVIQQELQHDLTEQCIEGMTERRPDLIASEHNQKCECLFKQIAKATISGVSSLAEIEERFTQYGTDDFEQDVTLCGIEPDDLPYLF